MSRPLIVLGSDHAGLELKQAIALTLQAEGYETTDVGTDSPDSCDYPVFANALCAKVREAPGRLGVLICGTGLGMSMAANKHPKILAALCCNEFMARMARRHNNANVLCLGARVVGLDLAKAIVAAFVESDFEGGRHQRRIEVFNK